MNVEIDDIRSSYYKGIKQYLSTRDEKWLSKAFEDSQAALQAGVSELDIINFHHEILPKVVNENSEFELESVVDHASTYLIEWMVAYDVKVKGYRELIEQLNKKNEVLNNEINQRQKVQRELKKNKEYFRSLIENAQDIITVLDEDGIVHYDTPSVYRILGYNREELVGSNALQFIHKDDMRKVEHAFLDVLKNSGKVVSVEFRFQHKNGNWVYLESIAKQVPDTLEGPMIIINSRDVTKRHKRLNKLRKQQIKLTEAQRIAKVGSWEWNINEEPELEWSDELYRIFGVRSEDFDQKYDTYISQVHPDDRDRVETEIKRAYKNKELFAFQHRIIRPDSEQRHVSCRGRLIEEKVGNPVKMIGTIQDITEQKEREEQLQIYSEKLRDLSERVERAREEERARIAREIHDELGQMLTVLKIDMSMFNESIKNTISEDLVDSLTIEMQQMMSRINTIIDSVHGITTKLRPEILDDVGLIEAVEWQAKEWTKRTDVSVKVNSFLDTANNFLTEDQKTTLFRIFQEAMNNIIQHAKATKVKVNFKTNSSDLFLIIKDNGVGISKEDQEARSSFGLIGMRERARFLGGDVHIEGEKGKGTRIKVQIPLNSNNTNTQEVE
jgi:PAS domain S-box-containing protein